MTSSPIVSSLLPNLTRLTTTALPLPPLDASPPSLLRPTLTTANAPFPNFSQLVPAVLSPVPIEALLTWDVASSGLVLSYFDAVAAAVSKSESGGIVDVVASDVVTSDVAAPKRPRPEPLKTAEAELKREHSAHLQWLRLCAVPSVPAADDRVAQVPSGEEPFYTLGLNAARAHLDPGYASGGPVLPKTDAEVEAWISNTIKRVNKQSRSRSLGPPPFKTLNASARAKYEDQYVHFLRDLRKNLDAFTDEPLPAARGASAPVAHIVPKAWTRPVKALAEFVGVEGDPTNVVTTFRPFNEEMGGAKAVYLGRRAYTSRFNDGKYWAPRNFKPKSRAAVARAVACVAMTYPFLSADDTAIVGGEGSSHANRPSGLPLYASQFDSIVKLLAEEPTLEDYTLAWIQFATFGWLNPLVVSKRTRTALASQTELGALLRKRLSGSDLGSRAAMRALEDLGVQFGRT